MSTLKKGCFRVLFQASFTYSFSLAHLYPSHCETSGTCNRCCQLCAFRVHCGASGGVWDKLCLAVGWDGGVLLFCLLVCFSSSLGVLSLSAVGLTFEKKNLCCLI